MADCCRSPLGCMGSQMLLGSLTSKRVQLDVSGTAKLDSVGINLLLLKGHKCRRQDICPLDWTPPELLLGRRCRPPQGMVQIGCARMCSAGGVGH